MKSSSLIERVTEIALYVSGKGLAALPDVFEDARFHDVTYLRRACERHGICLVEDEILPAAANRLAIAVPIEGAPFIVLDRSLSTPEAKLVPLAHELSHVALGHLSMPSFTSAGYSACLRGPDDLLFTVYPSETEIEADILAMMAIMPDSYLDGVVEQSIFIPTVSLARTHGLDVDYVAARVQLYRAIHGYVRSRALFRALPRDPLSSPDAGKWFTAEFSNKHYLERIAMIRYGVIL